jgi:hypothetical protein
MTLLGEHAIELCDTAADEYKQYKSNGGSVAGVQHKIDQLRSMIEGAKLRAGANIYLLQAAVSTATAAAVHDADTSDSKVNPVTLYSIISSNCCRILY